MANKLALVGGPKAVPDTAHKPWPHITEEDRQAVLRVLQPGGMSGDVRPEIEALEILTGVRAMQVAAGGVGGAEGSIWLLLEGAPEQIQETEELLDGIYGEPPWVRWDP